MSSFDRISRLFPETVARLERLRRENRMPHAFLVNCDDRDICRDFGVALAQIAVCESGKDGRPDAGCPVCAMLERHEYPDMHEIYPAGKSSQIAVGDTEKREENTIRDLIDRISLTASARYPHKFGFIHSADRMTREAQNALLKTLEEPPPNTIIVLDTAHMNLLLPTTISRCQIITLATDGTLVGGENAERLVSVMGEMCFPADRTGANAGRLSAELVAIFDGLKAEAERITEERYAPIIEDARQFDDAALIKKYGEKQKNDTVGEYRRMRADYLKVMETYASMFHMRSFGIPMESLPCPGLLPENSPEVDPLRGELVLSETSKLIRAMNTSASDELALTAYAFALVVL